jgi:hypothetical protein
MQKITNREGCRYNIETTSELPSDGKWSGDVFATPPSVGTRVRVKINELGTGVVQGYFVEHGWIGVHILPDARPKWHVKQRPSDNYYLVFGLEIEPAPATTTTFTFLVGGHDSPEEFEVHRAGCRDIARNKKRHHMTHHSYDVEATTAAEAVAGEVATYAEQQQDWPTDQFRIMPCCHAKRGGA